MSRDVGVRSETGNRANPGKSELLTSEIDPLPSQYHLARFISQCGTSGRAIVPFPASTIMKARKISGLGPGRPPSGKKPFTLRMPSGAYASLCRAARDDGFDHLGDWLAQLPGLVKTSDRIEPVQRLGKRLARRRFVIIAAKAHAFLDELYELVDYDTTIGMDENVAAATAELDRAFRKLKRFMNFRMTPADRM